MAKRDNKKIMLFESAYERALYDNAHMHFDDILNDPELKEKFREFCELFHATMIRKWGLSKELFEKLWKNNHKAGKKKKIGF